MKKIIQFGLSAILAFSGASMFIACTSAIADNPTTNNIGQPKKALLVILDGWGIGDKSKSDVIYHSRLLVSTWGFPTDRWETRRQDTLILVLDA